VGCIKAGKAAPGLIRHGLPKVPATGERPGTFRLHQRKTQIVAELIGSDTCAALGIVAHGNAPILGLCRQLVSAGYNPALALHAYRDSTLCLYIRTIGEAAGLEIASHGSGFIKRAVRLRAASPARKSAPSHHMTPSPAEWSAP
jgi:hypothetical protein